VIDDLEDIEVLPVKKLRKKQAPLRNTIQSSTIGKSINESHKTSQADELNIHFTKWIMPPQMQAYIKCPRYDFF